MRFLNFLFAVLFSALQIANSQDLNPSCIADNNGCVNCACSIPDMNFITPDHDIRPSKSKSWIQSNANFGSDTQFCDYIVIGMGTGGGVIGGILARDTSISVCFIETGTDISDKPEAQPVNMPNSPTLDALGPYFAHYYSNESRETTPASTPKDILFYQAKGSFGGATQVYTANLFRPSRNDANNMNISTLTFEKLQAAYVRSETYRDLGNPSLAAQEIAQGLRGGNGPMSVTNYPFGSTLQTWLDVCQQFFNLSYLPDNNIGDRLGCSQGQRLYNGTLFAPTRSTTWEGYVKPLLSQGNIFIAAEARATKILFTKDRHDNLATATGVQYVDINGFHTMYASKAVFLCAGSVGSPKLLQLSGVGDPVILNSLNIPVVVNNAQVGKNFEDKVSLSTMVFLMPLPAGVLPDFAQLFAFYHTKADFRDKHLINAFQLFFMQQITPSLVALVAVNQVGHSSSSLNKGYVYPLSTEPGIDPNFRFNHFTVKYPGDLYDIDTLNGIEATNNTFQLVNAFAQALGTVIIQNKPSTSQLTPSSSVAQFAAYVQNQALSGNGDGVQAVGAIRIGSDPSTSAADENFLIRGTSNLYTCDSASLNTITDGPPSGTIMAMAEILSDIIKTRYVRENN